MSLEERNNKKLTPDLVVGLDSGLEDLVGLLEKGKTELYSLQSITSFFVKNGYPEVVTILLKVWRIETVVPKFRAWFNAKMYNDPLIHDGKVYLDWRDFEDGRTFDDVVLSQSTGLFDKTGVEVFEGDVLYYPENPEGEKYGIVVWQKVSLAFVLETAFDYLPYNIWLVGEVVGNIYENPELLEEVACDNYSEY